MPRYLRGITINEVSAVDKGAGRRVRIMLMKHDGASLYADVDAPIDAEALAYVKREFSQDERDKLADKGHALPDGSFPIANVGDLKNAIHAIGRAKDPAKAKAHIKARAKALGATDELPDSWGDGGSVDKSITAFVTTRDAAEFARRISKIMESDMALDEKTQKLIAEEVAKAVGEATKKHAEELAKRDHELLVAKMSDKHKAFHAKLPDGKKKAFEDASAEQRDKMMSDADDDDAKKRAADPLYKSMSDQIEAMRKQGEADRAELKKIQDERDLDLCKRDAEKMGLRFDDAGAILQKARRGDREAFGKIEAELERINKAMAEQARTGVIFAEFGKKTEGGSGATAYDQLVAKGEELRKADPKLSKERAFAKAMEQNPDLVKRESEERMAKIHRAG